MSEVSKLVEGWRLAGKQADAAQGISTKDGCAYAVVFRDCADELEVALASDRAAQGGVRRYSHEVVGGALHWEVRAHEDQSGEWCRWSDVWQHYVLTRPAAEALGVPVEWVSPFGSCVCEGANQCPGCNPNEAIALAREIATAEERGKHPPCMECGAVSLEDAQGKCLCGGDKDDCHGCTLWPDTASPSQPEGVSHG